MSAAGEWLLDNFHVIAAEARQARHHLPRGYARQLPTIVAGPLAGEARITALATDLVMHSDGRLDAEQLRRFLNSFQTVAPLTIGELWAWPSALTLALIASLRDGDRRSAGRARAARKAADEEFARARAGRAPAGRGLARDAASRAPRADAAPAARVQPVARAKCSRPSSGTSRAGS